MKGLERLAKLGEAIERGDVKKETCRRVKGVEVISPGDNVGICDAHACERRWTAVFDALEGVEDVHIALPVTQIDRLLSSPALCASRALITPSAPLSLTLTPDSPSSLSSAYSWLCDTSTPHTSRLSFSSLRHLARHSKGVQKLVMKGRMEIKAPAGVDGTEGFEEGEWELDEVEVESEPHAAGALLLHKLSRPAKSCAICRADKWSWAYLAQASPPSSRHPHHSSRSSCVRRSRPNRRLSARPSLREQEPRSRRLSGRRAGISL